MPNPFNMPDPFDSTDPRNMPDYMFGGAELDYDSAVRADTSLQNYSVCPRYWYIDATLACRRCGQSFCFTAAEQRVWYEELHFWIDSFPRDCAACRRELRQLKTLRQEYDRDIVRVMTSGNVPDKQHMLDIISQLADSLQVMPRQMQDNQARLARQVEQAAKQ